MNSIHESKPSAKLPLYLVAIASILILVWILNYSRYGIDFTDESFYLVWAASPFSYDASVSQFGFILHPFYLLFDGNIAHFRQANVVVTYALACFLSFAVLTTASKDTLSITVRLVTSLGLATASLTLFSIWLVTPNYNSLNFQALLVAAIGIVSTSSLKLRNQLWGLILVGIGGWLSFMAKPSTAVILALLVAAYWVLSGNFRTRTALVPMVVSGILLLVSAWTIDGSVEQFVKRISMGLEVGRLLGGGHSIEKLFRLDNYSLSQVEKFTLMMATILPGVFGAALEWKKVTYRYLGIFALVSLYLLMMLVPLEISPSTAHFGMYKGLLLIFVLYGGIIYSIISLINQNPIQLSRKNLALACFLLLLPYSHAFGTNGNYWWAASFASFFWLFPGLILVVSNRGTLNTSNMIALLALAVQAVSVLLLQTGMDAPYRQTQALKLNDRAVEVGRPGSTLLLSSSFAEYLSDVTNNANAAKFQQNTPMIDLTGRSPGTLYALNADSVGQAWMIGGYPGSLRLAEFALKSVSCEKLAVAWLLSEPSGPRSISTSVLTTFGANLSASYQRAGSWSAPAGIGGHNKEIEQILWRPSRPPETAIEACIATRMGTNK